MLRRCSHEGSSTWIVRYFYSGGVYFDSGKVVNELDLEHPDITSARLTGYPRRKKEPAATGTYKKYTCADYSTSEDDLEMSIVNKIEIINQQYESLQEEYRLIHLESDSKGLELQFHDVDKFLKATDGHGVVVDDYALEYRVAVSKINGAKCFILLDEQEEKYLLEALSNE